MFESLKRAFKRLFVKKSNDTSDHDENAVSIPNTLGLVESRELESGERIIALNIRSSDYSITIPANIPLPVTITSNGSTVVLSSSELPVNIVHYDDSDNEESIQENLPEYTFEPVIQISDLIYNPSLYVTDNINTLINGERCFDLLSKLTIEEVVVAQNLPNISIYATNYLNEVRFNIVTYVKPFINNYKKLFDILSNVDNIDSNKGYISGSVVIQAICGRKFFNDNDDQDIDIYLVERKSPKYSTILKTDTQLFKLLKFLIDEEGYENTKTQFSGLNSINTYFMLVKGNRKIDVIIDRLSMDEIIADFYATHVMNYYDPLRDAIYGVRPLKTAKNISYIADIFLHRYRTNYNNNFTNEFRPIHTYINKDVFIKNNQILTRDRVTDEINIVDVESLADDSNINNSEISSNLQSNSNDTTSVSTDILENGLDYYRFFKKYSEYFKYKKIEGILKYKQRGFEFRPYKQIDELPQQTDFRIFNPRRRIESQIMSSATWNIVRNNYVKKVEWTTRIDI
ncbi:MAG: hypothetical protein ACRCZI_05940 [Cetobacterium sp.]